MVGTQAKDLSAGTMSCLKRSWGGGMRPGVGAGWARNADFRHLWMGSTGGCELSISDCARQRGMDERGEKRLLVIEDCVREPT